jgi:drug/metabolite transporter (DMT)-like permease
MHAPTPFHLLAIATSFAMVGICTGLALGAGANPLTVVTLRVVGTVLLFIVYFRMAGISLRLPPRERRIALGLGLPLCLNNYLLNTAMAEIPVPLAVLIFYLWPAITSVASWLLGTERFRWTSLAGLAAAFGGLALALDVEFTVAQAHGVWCALGASFAWSAVYLLMGRWFAGRDTQVPTLYMALTSATVFVAACLIIRDIELPQRASGWAGVLGVPFFYAFGMIGLFWASARLGAVRTGFFMNFEPIAAIVLAALILDQVLAPVQLAGAALVIAALYLFRAGGARRSSGASLSRRS